METIISAGIKNSDGRVFKGKSHNDIRLETLHKERILLDPFEEAIKEGFVTSSGEFVSREIAADIAYKSGQIKERVNRLCSYMLSL